MNNIFILTNYHKNFGTKVLTKPHASGFNKVELKSYFENVGYKVIYLTFSELVNSIVSNDEFIGNYYLYSSSEDENYFYKGFIEDVIYFIEQNGGIVIPSYKYLRATNNKLLMELLLLKTRGIDRRIVTKYYGTFEDLLAEDTRKFEFPLVCKPAGGAGSRGVVLVNTYSELIRLAKRVSRVSISLESIKDRLRVLRYQGYLSHSNYRHKFIIQTFIPGLDSDYKVLIFGEKYYVLKRMVRKNDFRASGSGIFLTDFELPDGILDYARSLFLSFKVPFLSVDIAFNGKDFFVIEIQFVDFGTLTLEKSSRYFKKDSETEEWTTINENSILEQVYVESIQRFIIGESL